jgi:hypothetical protein
MTPIFAECIGSFECVIKSVRPSRRASTHIGAPRKLLKRKRFNKLVLNYYYYDLSGRSMLQVYDSGSGEEHEGCPHPFGKRSIGRSR